MTLNGAKLQQRYNGADHYSQILYSIVLFLSYRTDSTDSRTI